MKIPTIVALLLLGATAQAQAPGPAATLFAQYQARERAFDPTLAELYCDSAVIRNTRTYADGQQRTTEVPAAQYRGLIRMALPLAKAKGDVSTYSDVVYVPEGDAVRITATRYSELKKYASPLSLLVGSCNGGAWAVPSRS